ncbi:MAG: hypothetical protein LKF96_05680 [Treponema sp.]|nr:hypothetical protein [Treponema sp.]
MYIFGWNATKKNYDDMQGYAWGDNLVVHQLEQAADGTLFAVPPFNTETTFPRRTMPVPVIIGKTISAAAGGLSGNNIWKCTLLIDNSTAVLYVNGTSSLSAVCTQCTEIRGKFFPVTKECLLRE